MAWSEEEEEVEKFFLIKNEGIKCEKEREIAVTCMDK